MAKKSLLRLLATVDFACQDAVAIEELILMCQNKLDCLICSPESCSSLIELTGLASPLPDARGAHGHTQQ